MSPSIATLVFLVGIGMLFFLDPIRKSHTSAALGISIAWFSLACSRSVSTWLAGFSGGGSVSEVMSNPDFYLEGNPTDRAILMGLLALGVMVLAVRWRKVGRLLWANPHVVCFFLYCATSCLWSDYPDVAFKRWSKLAGDLVMVLIVLTDADPLVAVKRFLAWTGFVLIPVSVLLIKYYPELGRGYRPWEWTPYYTGVTTDKNGLGYICLIFGVASVWRLFSAWRHEKDDRRPKIVKAHGVFPAVVVWLFYKAGPRRMKIFVAHGMILLMVAWLFYMAGSMTSLSCFFIGVCILASTSLRIFRHRDWLVHGLVASILLASSSTLFSNAGSGVLQTMGRNPTLTGRTDIWKLVLKLAPNPVVGTGFGSFWLGERLKKIWDIYWWHPNQCHNGYIEVFINLGWVGVALLGILLVGGYRQALRSLWQTSDAGKLILAYLVIAVAYNFTEAAFKEMHPVWIILMLSVLAVPGGWEPLRRKNARVESVRLQLPEEACLENA